MYTEVREHMRGGDGEVIIKHILDDEQLNEKCRLYGEVTLAPGCSIGYHEHHGESETFYILSGTGEFNDNGETRTVNPGDITVTADGCGHALKNTGESDLVLMALILLN